MMRFTMKLGPALKMAAVATLGLTALGQPGPAAAQDLPGGTWGLAQAVNLTPALPAGSQLINDNVADVSCTSPGNCAALGYYGYMANTVPSVGVTYPFVMSETGGTWGPPAAVSGITSGPPMGPAIVSCAAPGECAATWTSDPSGHTYLIDESGGVWGKGQPVTIGTGNNTLNDVSCPAAGDCTAVGSYSGSTPGATVPFVMDSSNGTWGAPQELPGVASLSSPVPTAARLTSLSCTSAGNCVAGGTYDFTSTDHIFHQQPFLAIETDGSWGQAQNVAGVATLNPADAAELGSVSCGAPGDCAAIGWYSNLPPAMSNGNDMEAWVADESGGNWGPAQQLPVPAASFGTSANALSLSCPAQGFCVAAGSYFPVSSGYQTAFTATYASGAWTAQDVPGLIVSGQNSEAIAVSCVAPGYCTVAGTGTPLSSETSVTFLAEDINGTWANAQGQPGIYGGPPLVSGLSCTAPGYCTAGGSAGNNAFTVSEATASAVTLHASAPTVTYGNEQSETLTATVTSPAGGTPTGTVTVTDGTVAACSITLANGTGSCTLTAAALPAGTDHLTATYNGDASYAATSSTATITVAKVTYRGTIRLTKMGLCLDDRNNSSSNGAVVQVWRCNGLPSQRWQVESDGTIRHNGLCLDASRYGTANGTKVQLWACTSKGNQKWDTRGYRIHYDNPAATGKVLDDTGYGGNGTQQEIWTNRGTINQIWSTT